MKSTSLRTPVLCLSLLALAACGKKDQAPPQAPPPEVGVIKAQTQSTPLTEELVGRLSPYRSADVRARVPGVLLKRTYTEGANVKEGQVMFQIDPAPLKAVLANAQGNLAQQVATYTNNKIAAQRARELAPKGYISKSDLDNAEAAERNAAAAVQAARANVESAKINLGFTSVTAPISGRSNQQQVTEGALVGQSDTTLLTTVDQIDKLYVNFTMSVADLDRLRGAASKGDVTLAGQDKTTVQVTLPDGSRYQPDALLDFSSTTVNPTTGAVNLRAVVQNPDQRLLPGQYVTLTANLGEQHNVFLIPQQGILRDVSGAYALIVGADGKVVRKGVTANNMSNGNWIVTGGLTAGDQVIVSGVQAVQPGAPAKASPWQPGQNAGPPNAAQGGKPAAGKQ
ncbi:MAG TPA: efflux RND transporter periplasmic adaptor subunit [Dyella sp.]|uniref:efflux RND transporter periplasmic adaptor subunit n=1 Tax=Dyella sp. TaxID=1869338 RepID=UPI002F95F067